MSSDISELGFKTVGTSSTTQTTNQVNLSDVDFELDLDEPSPAETTDTTETDLILPDDEAGEPTLEEIKEQMNQIRIAAKGNTDLAEYIKESELNQKRDKILESTKRKNRETFAGDETEYIIRMRINNFVETMLILFIAGTSAEEIEGLVRSNENLEDNIKDRIIEEFNREKVQYED